jgi:hypothetical protein
MRTFINKIFLHSIIPSCIILYLIFIGYSHNLHITRFAETKFIIGEPYTANYIEWYKWKKKIDKIDLIAIGSSRVLQFKSEFFAKPFFNLGYLVSTPKQTLELIKAKQIQNKTIIISLDQWAFNREWAKDQGEFINPSEPNFLETSISAGRLIDILKFKIFPISNSSHILKIGAGANVSLDGMTPDGSYYHGKIYHGLLTNNQKLIGEDYHFLNTIDRINKGDRRFQYGLECYQDALNDFENLVKYNLRSGNRVIYFFPPFAPTIQKFLKGENYRYIVDASKKINQIAKKNNVVFVDHTFLKSTDEMYIDGFHGGAELYFNIAKSMRLNTKDCQFINHFETNNDIIFYKERIRFFNSSKSN